MNCKELTKRYIEELSSLEIALPIGESIRVLDTLKALKRSGKLVRLYPLLDRVKVRSVYDHMISLSYFADEVYGEVSSEVDIDAVASLIAYHEVGEVFIGDIPRYTSVEDTPLDYLNDNRLSGYTKEEIDAIASRLVGVFANDEQRGRIEHYVSSIENDESVEARFFEMIDLLDPIICVWRYVYHSLDDEALAYRLVEALSDYFVYPRTYSECKICQFEFSREIVANLCNIDNAKRYIQTGDLSLAIDSPMLDRLVRLIECTPIFC